jgi:hypothetical protein
MIDDDDDDGRGGGGDDDDDGCWAISGMSNLQGKPKYSQKTCLSAHHKSHITWPELEPRPARWEVGA